MSVQYPKEYPFEGEMLTIAEISKRTGIPKNTIRQRLNHYEMSFDRAFSTDDLRIERLKKETEYFVEYEGELISITELSERIGIKPTTLRSRYRYGDRGERLWRPLEHKQRKVKRWYD